MLYYRAPAIKTATSAVLLLLLHHRFVCGTLKRWTEAGAISSPSATAARLLAAVAS